MGPDKNNTEIAGDTRPDSQGEVVIEPENVVHESPETGAAGTPEPLAACCGNCAFGRDENFTRHDVKVFACRRFPPHQTGSQQSPERYPFPMVVSTEWCGEHRKRMVLSEIPFGGYEEVRRREPEIVELSESEIAELSESDGGGADSP